jgi:hypothetical protein
VTALRAVPPPHVRRRLLSEAPPATSRPVSGEGAACVEFPPC